MMTSGFQRNQNLTEALQVEDKQIAEVFCWTKIGAEAGQSLEKILLRKELERRAGKGVFAWGIGNSLGGSVDIARQEHSKIDVLFSLIKSPAKIQDVEPDKVLLWLDYFDDKKVQVNLPNHMIITSRGNLAKAGNKRSHYALLCNSSEDITSQSSSWVIDANRARNYVSSNPLGASQVTSLVRYQSHQVGLTIKPYPVKFRATLNGVGFIRLASPVLVTGELKNLYTSLCKASTVEEWVAGAEILRRKAEEFRMRQETQSELYECASRTQFVEKVESLSGVNRSL